MNKLKIVSTKMIGIHVTMSLNKLFSLIDKYIDILILLRE